MMTGTMPFIFMKNELPLAGYLLSQRGMKECLLFYMSACRGSITTRPRCLSSQAISNQLEVCV